MNEEQGGFQQLTGFSRIRGNRNLGGKAPQTSADERLAEIWDELQAEWNRVMNPGTGESGNGGSTGVTDFKEGDIILIRQGAEGRVLGTILVEAYHRWDKLVFFTDGSSAYAEGVEINLKFTNMSKKYDYFEWIQGVLTNEPGPCGKYQYCDPCTSDGEKLNDYYPFYHDEQQSNNWDPLIQGYDSGFFDRPGREPMSGKTISWTGEVSLLGWNKSRNNDDPLITIQYGFSLSVNANNNSLSENKMLIVQPSEFQKNLILAAQLKYSLSF